MFFSSLERERELPIPRLSFSVVIKSDNDSLTGCSHLEARGVRIVDESAIFLVKFVLTEFVVLFFSIVVSSDTKGGASLE